MMRKLNRKGYLAIEIILASTITFVIAFFLIDITMKLVGTTDDEYVDAIVTTDKAIIIKNIKENLEKDIEEYGGIDYVDCYNNTCEIYFYYSGGPEQDRKIDIDDNIVKYMDLDDVVIYEKDIDDRLSNFKISYNDDFGYYMFRISGNNIFSGKVYDINIVVNGG